MGRVRLYKFDRDSEVYGAIKALKDICYKEKWKVLIYFYIIDFKIKIEENIIKIGCTGDHPISYLEKKQNASLVPLKCIGVVSKIKNYEPLQKEESFIHRLLNNYLHHGRETFLYNEKSKKIINVYLNTYMKTKDYEMMNDINKSFKEIWRGYKRRGDRKKQICVENELVFECKYCHKIFKLEDIEKYKEHEKGYCWTIYIINM